MVSHSSGQSVAEGYAFSPSWWFEKQNDIRLSSKHYVIEAAKNHEYRVANVAYGVISMYPYNIFMYPYERALIELFRKFRLISFIA
jgi:hypothetical protein